MYCCRFTIRQSLFFVACCCSWLVCWTYLCSLCFLVQQCQPRQVLQEGVGGVKHLGQEVETFLFVVVENLDKKKKKKKYSYKVS